MFKIKLLLVRDSHSFEKIEEYKDISPIEARTQINKFIERYLGFKQECIYGWHNFPNLNNNTKCKDCGISVKEFNERRKEDEYHNLS